MGGHTCHSRLSPPQVLQQYGAQKPEESDQWPVVAQFSSIGSLGSSPKQWLTSELLGSLSVWRSATLGAGPGKLPYLQLVSGNAGTV